MESEKYHPLSDFLMLAVPLWAMRCQRMPLNELIKKCGDISQVIGEKGDIILFKTKKEGESAKAFNRLAEGIAILSFVPGGVTFMGTHYENIHPDSEVSESEVLRATASTAFRKRARPDKPTT